MEYGLKLTRLNLNGVYIVNLGKKIDSRGVFSRLFCAEDMGKILGDRLVVQINYSSNRLAGTIRGLHYQHFPNADMKIVRCVKGAIWDVVVDLRQDSPTFLHWTSIELREHSSDMVIIPEGCAHGFQVLEDNSELLYFHTNYYKKECEGGFIYDDPTFNISWPLEVTEISEKDRNLKRVYKHFNGVKV